MVYTPESISKLDWTELKALKLSAEAENNLWKRIADVHEEAIAQVYDRFEDRVPGFFNDAVLVKDKKLMRSMWKLPNGWRFRIDTWSVVNVDAVSFYTDVKFGEVGQPQHGFEPIMEGKTITCFWSSIPSDYIKGNTPPNDFNHH